MCWCCVGRRGAEESGQDGSLPRRAPAALSRDEWPIWCSICQNCVKRYEIIIVNTEYGCSRMTPMYSVTRHCPPPAIITLLICSTTINQLQLVDEWSQTQDEHFCPVDQRFTQGRAAQIEKNVAMTIWRSRLTPVLRLDAKKERAVKSND